MNEIRGEIEIWVNASNRKAELIDEICKIAEGDLFFSKSSRDIALLSPARKMIIDAGLFESLTKSDSFEYSDEHSEPQWNTNLWSSADEHKA